MNILICGLGNPGAQYSKNRHNVGFRMLDFIASRMDVCFSESKKFLGYIAIKKCAEVTYILLKPQTYMNLSGQSVVSVRKFYNISLDHIWIVHDDIDIDFGDVRFKKGGGNAGHNGLKSIDAYIGKDYHRIRIGIGRPACREDVANYVLSNFSKNEDVEGVMVKTWIRLCDTLGYKSNEDCL